LLSDTCSAFQIFDPQPGVPSCSRTRASSIVEVLVMYAIGVMG